MTTLRTTFNLLWKASPPLTAATLLMLAAFVFSVAGVAFSPSVITGMPAWLKPAKFAISTATYALTFAWIFTYLPGSPHLTRIVGWVTAVVIVAEVIVIDIQAARGTTSHFNVSTALDATIFASMGAAILVLWIASIALTVAVFRQRFADEALGWAIRLGLLITVFGSATGGIMTAPTQAQMAEIRAGGRVATSGAHTVGAPDGGPGLLGTGWSTQHGDIRVGHFVGLHAVQVIPLLLVLFRRVRPAGSARAIVLIASASYATLFVILLTQALRGESIVAPDATTAATLIAWAGATFVATTIVWLTGRRSTPTPRANAVVMS
jgi:hypothetical protein